MSTPTLKDLISSAEGANWDWFENLDKRMGLPDEASKLAKAERERLAASAVKVANTPEGQHLLEHFTKSTLLRTVFVTQLGHDPLQSAMYGAFREGQNAFMTQWLRLIAEGRRETPPPNRGE